MNPLSYITSALSGYRTGKNLSGGSKQPSTPTQPTPITGDPAKAVGYLNGRPYNFAGDYLDNPTAPPPVSNPDPNGYLAQLRALQAQQARQVYAPKLDLTAINAQARKQAEESVNPLYTKRLNDLLTRQTIKRQRGQEDLTTTNQALETALKQTQEQNAITKARTGEDVTSALGQIDLTADRSQTDVGTQFEDERLATARTLAAGGVTGAGVGEQQVRKAIEGKNVAEARQEEDFDFKRTAQNIFKARTFEDLERSTTQAGERTAEGKKAAQVQLDRLLQDVDLETEIERTGLESERYRDIASQTGSYGQRLVNEFIAGIRDPAQREAAIKTYGGAF